MAELLEDQFYSGPDTEFWQAIMWGGLSDSSTFKSNFPKFLPDGSDNPEYQKIIATLNAERTGTNQTYTDENGNLVTVTPYGEQC